MSQPRFPEYGRPQSTPPPETRPQTPRQDQWPYTVPQQPPASPGHGYPAHRRSAPSGLAIAAFAVCAVALAGFVLMVVGIAMNWDNEPLAGADKPAPVVVPTDEPTDEPVDESVDESGGFDAYIDEVAEGDCFDESDDEEYDVFVVPCDLPHSAEAVAAVILTPGKFPGDRAVEDAARQRCDKEFASYVGVSVYDTELDADFYYPVREAWEDGDRTVVCVAWGSEGKQLTGTVRDSKR